MKKNYNALFIIVLLFIVLIPTVKANSPYTIEVPSTFKKDKNNAYWQKEVNNEKVSILIYTTNNDNELNLDNINDKDINNDEYINVLKNTFKQLGYKITSYSSNFQKTTLNSYPAIVIDIDSKYTLESNAENVVYQRQYMLTSKNNIYYIIISSSNKKYLENEEINSILTSFEINDELVNKNSEMTKYYITLTLIVSLGVVIAFVFSKKK